VPTFRRPPSKFGNSDTPELTGELENPDPPNDEFPRSEPRKPEAAKRESPKFAIERPEEPEENDENDENRGDADRSVAKRFAPNPKPVECRFEAVSRLDRKDESPELFRPKVEALEFPNERHWLPLPALLAETRDSSAPPPRLTLPKECQPAPTLPDVRAEASIDRPDEFPKDVHEPMPL
jgi:hypothetical protein